MLSKCLKNYFNDYLMQVNDKFSVLGRYLAVFNRPTPLKRTLELNLEQATSITRMICFNVKNKCKPCRLILKCLEKKNSLFFLIPQ